MFLNVYLGEGLVGTLAADEIGRMIFTYRGSHRRALSLSLPRRPDPYDDTACRPFFAGLLPEGDALQRVGDGRRLQVYETYSLLAALGRECTGAARLLPEGEPPEIRREYEQIDDAALAGIRTFPNFADARVRLLLPGAQSKMAVRVQAGSIYKPLRGSPSTHIVKVGSARCPDLPQNEAFCMTLAARLGLPIANVNLHTAAGTPCLLVERYDRAVEGSTILMYHQEDFCQALGYLPARKYELDHATGEKIGPGLKECFDLVRRVSRQPELDVQILLDRVIVNYLIGNADAHAKNLSILYDDHSLSPILAPAYDLVCTAVYPDVATQLAMRLGDVSDPEQMSAVSWEGVTQAAGVSFDKLRGHAHRLARGILPAADAIMATVFGHQSPYRDVRRVIGQRATRISDDLDLGS